MIRSGVQQLSRRRGCRLFAQVAFQRWGPDDPIARRRDWGDMGQETRNLWGALGWTEHTWKQNHPLPGTEFVQWAALSESQRDAASRLGYTEDVWNAEDESEDALFNLNKALAPPELILGAAAALVGFGLLCRPKARPALKDDDACCQHHEDHHERA
ncbi:hypothetical protein CTAYLR_008060 [Chrysophaeum taylorii]|uniref:Uncharacterized protein n=1 Tax=Chrysophaeum taylorii TaxID=2483200 RepID=A0AAD7UJH7_9STRA|nr:hypothetical protein CTAYLR_008060 [Chrysophaeum taylorii]